MYVFVNNLCDCVTHVICLFVRIIFSNECMASNLENHTLEIAPIFGFQPQHNLVNCDLTCSHAVCHSLWESTICSALFAKVEVHV